MRALLFGLTAGASGLLAASGFAAAAWLDAFAPCRVLYRVSDAVHGSLACQSYYAIVLFSTGIAFGACGIAAIGGILFLVRRRAPQNERAPRTPS
jgi:hypothetical protein